MSQLPPPMPMPNLNYGPPPQRPANAWAIVSLVCGIVGCLVVTPFAAIVTGIVGLGQARERGGRGMAVTGIVLGVLWVVGGAALIGGGVLVWKNAGTVFANSEKPHVIALINRVAGGDRSRDAASQQLGDADLEALAAAAKPLGNCREITVNAASFSAAASPVRVEFGGVATFEHGSLPVHVRMHNPQPASEAWVFDSVELK